VEKGSFDSLTVFNADGYSLVELIITMVVIGILSAIVIISLPNSSYKNQLDAEKLIVNIRYAQEKAMNEGKECCISFQGKKYSLSCNGKSVSFADGSSSVELNETASVQCGNETASTVCLSYTGSPECSKTVRIALGSKEIDIYPLTGGVFEKQ